EGRVPVGCFTHSCSPATTAVLAPQPAHSTHSTFTEEYRGKRHHQAARGQGPGPDRRGRDHHRFRPGHSGLRQGEAAGGHRHRRGPGPHGRGRGPHPGRRQGG